MCLSPETASVLNGTKVAPMCAILFSQVCRPDAVMCSKITMQTQRSWRFFSCSSTIVEQFASPC